MEPIRVQEILNASFGKGRNPAVQLLQGSIVDVKVPSLPPEDGSDGRTICMRFRTDRQFEEVEGSGTTQSGVAAAILDAVCANAVVLHSGLRQTVATLEQQCSFLEAIPSDRDLYATAILLRMSKKFAFLKAELRLDDPERGVLIAKSTQTNSLLALPEPKANKTNNHAKL
mmetsp:Transcript_21595/g.42416  ORF Transcript_21595/g.42416 Transcript_21595/m.42416 type:complete len:171 (-) Transcript_21595:219-731(-)|eukprot:CAMPEP_0171525426 /NCGR_PEP_ID=MMETSP0959-20130129/9715_1 /TAXON_ID=87120 /ORGANISM="Aurantiochytrium limacinum, Strain ATCCMYA-1381" /LENGTH=170 /DNA_ID=CAMNT_0012066505 /DNA_START=43 /DNA_END=555 /DNA_ORIENTATION=+